MTMTISSLFSVFKLLFFYLMSCSLSQVNEIHAFVPQPMVRLVGSAHQLAPTHRTRTTFAQTKSVLSLYHIGRSSKFHDGNKDDGDHSAYSNLHSQPERWRFFPTITMAMMILLNCMCSPSNALDATVYTNDYGDPLHPMCQRRIEVASDGRTFHYSGTDVGAPTPNDKRYTDSKNDDGSTRHGCSIPEIRQFKQRRSSFDGIVLDNGSISAGDGIHEGMWEPAGSASTKLGYEHVDGIRWSDGNKWFIIQKKNPPGVLAYAISYGYLIASGLAGVYGVYRTNQRKQESSSG